jgi:hypothetical protein
MSLLEKLRLSLRFDPSSLACDLARIPDKARIAHCNKRDYEGDWSGVALRGPANVTHPIQSLFATPGTTDWANTDVHDGCPYFAEVMASFRCPLQSVRLLRLSPGSEIKQHRDHELGLEDGEVRIHVPVQTSPDVEFVLNSERVALEVGEVWYLNVNFPHRVANRSDDFRVHMVIDCGVDDWLRQLFRESAGG